MYHLSPPPVQGNRLTACDPDRRIHGEREREESADPQPRGCPFPRTDLRRKTQNEYRQNPPTAAVRDDIRASSSTRFTIKMKNQIKGTPGIHPGCPLATTGRSLKGRSFD